MIKGSAETKKDMTQYALTNDEDLEKQKFSPFLTITSGLI